MLASAVAAFAFVAPGHGQSPDSYPILLQDISAGAVDRGLMTGDVPPPSRGPRVNAERVGDNRAHADRASASGATYMPGRVIVKFRDGVSTGARLSALSSASPTAALATQKPYANFDTISIDPNEDPEAVARSFASRPDVEYAQAAYRVRPYFVPNDPEYRRQWNMLNIDMERAWDIQPGASSSVIVAVLDTGVAYQDAIMRYNALGFCLTLNGRCIVTYPALGLIDVPFAAAPDLRGTNRFVVPRDFIWENSLPFDLVGHGTHVSGTIGQNTNNGVGTAGIAYNVRIMPVKVIDDVWDLIFGSPNEGTDDTVARGVRYAADNGAKVLNMSIGRSGPSAPVVEDAIKYAVGKGAFVAIAAGNDFEDGNPTEVLAEIASRVQGAVSVGALDRQHNRAFYSSTGPWVELSAPGGSSRVGGEQGTVYQQTYDLSFVETFDLPPAQYHAPRFDVMAIVPFQGTSMATPHVSGVAALLIHQGITDPATIEAALERFAADRGPTGKDNETGYGEISARNTLRGLGLSK